MRLFDPESDELKACPECGSKKLTFYRRVFVEYCANMYESESGYLTWDDDRLEASSEEVDEQFIRCSNCGWDSREHEVEGDRDNDEEDDDSTW